MTSPTHDAVGATTAYLGYQAVTGERLDPYGLLFALLLVASLGGRGYVATRKQRRSEVKRKEARKELVRRGMSAHDALEEVPKLRWDGPSRRESRSIRWVAWVAAGITAWPVAVALACSRLPDQLERGPAIFRWGGEISVRLWRFDHRETTHKLWFAVPPIVGLWFGVCQIPDPAAEEVATALALAVACGYLMHLVADGCTLDGLPFRKKSIHLLPKAMRVRTGGGVDLLVLLAMVAIVAVPVAVEYAPRALRLFA